MDAIIYGTGDGTNFHREAIPEDMKELAEKYHSEMVENVVELDEDLMMKYLEGEEPSVDELKKAIRKGTISNEIVPVTCGTAYRNKGVQPLLDAIVDFMPAPTDVESIKGIIRTRTRRNTDILPIQSRLPRLHSRLLPTRSLESFAISAYTPVRSTQEQPFITP